MTGLDSDEDVRRWLARFGLEHVAGQFAAGGWRGERLLDLSPRDLIELLISGSAVRVRAGEQN